MYNRGMKAAPAKPVRWTTSDYFRMAAAGLFDRRRVELLQGEIIQMAAQETPHRAAVSRLSRLLLNAFDASHWVVIQGTLKLSAHSAPDPDFHVFDVPVGTPDQQLPKPLLVIEVSDSTYRIDSGRKLRAYARAGIPDYWIVNLPKQRLEVYRAPARAAERPSPWHYAQTLLVPSDAQVSPLRRPDLRFGVRDMLG